MMTKHYVWEFPLRLSHWVNFLAITILAFTGIYMGNPSIYVSPGERFFMTGVKFTHIVAAYLFTVSFLLRIYWGFAGNSYARLRFYVPTKANVWKEMVDEVKFYLLLKKEHKACIGHCPWAAFVYHLLFAVFVAEIVTGFALYSQSHQGTGVIWKIMGGWLLSFFPAPAIRLYHHLIMWLLVLFTIAHVYIGWLFDLTEKNFVMGSIFTGYKVIDEEESCFDRVG
jgi:Ni/Fe-hydrogenase 1 B-type cytochrome subunit